ncbi:hypothetical protein HMPREF0433_01818 [Gemella sanguinis M325]|nr:hypothetical protein [Gemella sanguinis]EPC06447.1 hypothetical protein HMPREF0433_01818 [Gemella sanguinis M325]
MKLLTINVHSWLENNQLEKLDILAKTIVEKNMMLSQCKKLIS